MKYLISILLLSSLSSIGASQNTPHLLNLDFTMKFQNNDTSYLLTDSQVEVHLNNKLIKVVTAKDNGRISVDLPLDQQYVLHYKCEGFKPLLIEVDCTGLSKEQKEWDYEMGGRFILDTENSTTDQHTTYQRIIYNTEIESFEIKN